MPCSSASHNLITRCRKHLGINKAGQKINVSPSTIWDDINQSGHAASLEDFSVLDRANNHFDLLIHLIPNSLPPPRSVLIIIPLGLLFHFFTRRNCKHAPLVAYCRYEYTINTASCPLAFRTFNSRDDGRGIALKYMEGHTVNDFVPRLWLHKRYSAHKISKITYSSYLCEPNFHKERFQIPAIHLALPSLQLFCSMWSQLTILFLRWQCNQSAKLHCHCK